MNVNVRKNQSVAEENRSTFTPAFVPNKFMIQLSNHLSAAVASAGKLMRSPLATIFTLVVIGIALALPTSLFLLLANVKQVSSSWNDNSQITLYLKSNVSASQTQSLMRRLRNQPAISGVQYISPSEGLTELQNQMDLQNAIATLNQNPLPGVILVTPNKIQSPDELNQLLQNLKQLPAVDVAQMDMQWVKRLSAIIDLCKRITFALGLLLGVGVLFIIGNTIHLNLQKYRHEITVFKLVGATNGFIRRPFLYTGVLYGFFGSIVALILVSLLLAGLVAPIHKLTNLYNSNFHLQGISFSSIVTLLIVGILLGLIGAWLAVGKHLRCIS